MKIEKSRDIPIVELFSVLQLEYLSYRFRELLYAREQDRIKFHEICIKKKEKIQNLGLRNCHDSIFNSKHKLDLFLGKFINPWGLPNFCYRDDYQRRVKGHWDRFYYFQKGALVKVEMKSKEVLDGVVSRYINPNSILVKVGSEISTYSINQLFRIFSEEFFIELV